MNERITDLLDRASDDRDAPIGFSGDQILRRARARRRRRHGVVAAGLAAAAVTGILVVTQLVGSSQSAVPGPSDGPTTASGSPTPTLSPQQREVVDRCARQHLPEPPVVGSSSSDDLAHPGAGTTVRDSTTGGPTASFLRGWTLDASVQDDLGLTAAFVNPAHTRWASCDIAAGETRDGDGVFTAPLPSGPVPHSWFGPNGFRHQGNTVSWSQVCTPSEGQICARELFAGALVRYDDVAAVAVTAPDGAVLHPVLGDDTYVFRHVEPRVPTNRPSNDLQPLHSMPVTLLDDQGHRIIRYDYFPAEILPGSCSSPGGC